MSPPMLKDLREIRGSQPDPLDHLDRDQLFVLIVKEYRQLLAQDGSHAQVVANVRATDHPFAAETANRLDTMFSDGSLIQ